LIVISVSICVGKFMVGMNEQRNVTLNTFDDQAHLYTISCKMFGINKRELNSNIIQI
jgi:hypothetical protein